MDVQKRDKRAFLKFFLLQGFHSRIHRCVYLRAIMSDILTPNQLRAGKFMPEILVRILKDLIPEYNQNHFCKMILDEFGNFKMGDSHVAAEKRSKDFAVIYMELPREAEIPVDGMSYRTSEKCVLPTMKTQLDCLMITFKQWKMCLDKIHVSHPGFLVIGIEQCIITKYEFSDESSAIGCNMIFRPTFYVKK